MAGPIVRTYHDNMRPGIVISFVLLLLVGLHSAADESEVNDIDTMLAAIRDDAQRTADYTGQASISAPVMLALQRVRRGEFVPDSVADRAYDNIPLAIGHRQTISQPFIVALMTDLLNPAPGMRVLEIGTGSGYQAAVLAELVAEVYTIEIVPALAARAAATLSRLRYDNVRVKDGDGWFGWPEAAPFDGIIITAVAAEPPPRLLEQLRTGGRMVLPLGPPHGGQMLVVLTKDATGQIARRDVLPVQFVPFTRRPAAP
jgi:protein-L-isoaspartate(D-aspartate) O-methyltransferase